jgi:hypothetical protein
MTVPVQCEERTYCVYFGLLKDLGDRLSVPMTLRARAKYREMARAQFDARITVDLTNRRSGDPAVDDALRKLGIQA